MSLYASPCPIVTFSTSTSSLLVHWRLLGTKRKLSRGCWDKTHDQVWCVSPAWYLCSPKSSRLQPAGLDGGCWNIGPERFDKVVVKKKLLSDCDRWSKMMYEGSYCASRRLQICLASCTSGGWAMGIWVASLKEDRKWKKITLCGPFFPFPSYQRELAFLWPDNWYVSSENWNCHRWKWIIYTSTNENAPALMSSFVPSCIWLFMAYCNIPCWKSMNILQQRLTLSCIDAFRVFREGLKHSLSNPWSKALWAEKGGTP